MSVRLPIYLDSHATTPCDPRVVEKMLPFFTERFGNPSSENHSFGRVAREAVEKAREAVAELLGAKPDEILFTSGATESNHLVFLGLAEAYGDKKQIVTAATEHKSVLRTCEALEGKGYEVTWLPLDSFGRVSPDDVKKAIGPRTLLVSLMAANNEVGTLHPVEEIGKIVRDAGVFFHCDAAQAVGKIPIDVERLGVDFLTFSGHKLYAPKGIGALYLKRRTPRIRLATVSHGAGHERGLRSGTLNVPGIVGLGEACAIATKEMATESTRVARLRDRLRERITTRLEGVRVNGHPTERLPQNLNLSFTGVDGEALLKSFTDIALSSGSACTAAGVEPSYVLRALGVEERLAVSSLRFGLGRSTTEEEIDYAADVVISNVTQLRKRSALG